MDQRLVRFGGFDANLRTRELWRHGTRVPMQDQPFQILAMLLERPGDVVTRDEIRNRLWPDGTSVDFEHSVNAAIKRLRAALGDTADSPRFVETLPRRGYRLVVPIADSATPAVASGPDPKSPPRILVLPFEDLSHERANDYFSDGMTEEMISQLGRLLGARVRVIARTSSMLLKGTRQSVSEIGTTFGAAYLMEGSVRRDGDRLRVTTQLIETTGGTHLWAESYDRRLADVLAVQQEVAEAIARSLVVELLPGAVTAARDARHPDAYQAYLKGLFHWNKPGDTGLQASLEYFDQAISIDPAFAAAHAGLARCHVSRAEYYRERPRVALEAARAAAARALDLNPHEEQAHVAMAEVRRVVDWDPSGARASYCLAFSANPSSHAAHRYYAVFLAARGESDEATAVADRACELDPFCLATNLSGAFVRFLSRQYDEVIRRCADILDKDQNYIPARRLMATAMALVGRCDEAIAGMTSVPGTHLDPVSQACLGYVAALAKDRTQALAVRDLLTRRDGRDPVPAYSLALLQTALGNRDVAIEELQAACEERDPWLDTIGVDPRFEPLRGDPRFRAILNRLRLTEAAA
jgi:TolB-like protein